MEIFSHPQAAFVRTAPGRYLPPPDEACDEVDDSAPEFPELEPGRVRVGRDIISEEGLMIVADLAKQIKLDESLSPKRLENLMKDIRETQTADKVELQEFDKFVRGVQSWHRELHTTYRESDYTDKKANQSLVKVHQFLQQWEGARERYRVQARTLELGRIAEGSPAFSPTTAGFYTFATISQKNMKETLSQMERIRQGDDTIVYNGNSAQVLTRDQIWSAKMKMLETATSTAKNGGVAPEVDVQYYELTSRTMLTKLVEASKAGCKVRVNLDPGRVTEDRSGNMFVNELAKKLYTSYCILDAADQGHDIGMTLFPVEREIDDANLMHQKLFRVGEEVILGGMNANSASSENVDAAVKLQGPGARRLVEIFAEDTELSKGAKIEDIYDSEKTALISAGNMYIGPSGLISLLLAAAGTDYRGVDKPLLPWNADTLHTLAEAAGTRLDLIVDFEDKNGDKTRDGLDLQAFLQKGDTPSNTLALKREGGRLLARQLKEVVERVQSEDNVERAGDITLPEGKQAGKSSLAIGNAPTERMAVMLSTIATAEEFIYVPSFVMTRVVARAIVARYEELKAQGKTLDVRAVLDPGIYPDGGTPNEAGYLALEDAGIPVRWALLARTDPTHDRKVHAKALITEKMAVLGSTNMSSRGLMDNWELSGSIGFDPQDAESQKQKRALVNDFLKTWELESVEVSTLKVAEERLREIDSPDKPHRINEARSSIVREVIRRIYNYEKEAAAVVRRLVDSSQEVREAIDRRVDEGAPEGYATLTSIEEVLGPNKFQEELRKTDSWKSLEPLSKGDYLELPNLSWE